MEEVAVKDSLVSFTNSEGAEIRATLIRLSRQSAFFEIHSPNSVLKSSEVLSDFRIVWQDRDLYSGRAVIANLVTAGTSALGEAELEEPWDRIWAQEKHGGAENLTADYQEFFAEWQKLYRVRPEFKELVADFQTFLTDLRLWLEQIELRVRAQPTGSRLDSERQAAHELAQPVIASIDNFIDRFEHFATALPLELQPVHRSYLRRQLHPLLLASPFAYRTFRKPLGYAGDYEMVNMMLRQPCEGSTLFAKLINIWLLGQAPVAAHRNRITYLTQKLTEETLRCRASGQRPRIFNLGCGPAVEIENFLQASFLSDLPSFTLLDFNEETLTHVRARLEGAKRQHGRHPQLNIVKKSVNQVLKDGARYNGSDPALTYDLVYCAGLFDYLSDQVCKRLMTIFYEMLAPGGLLIATNVSETMNASHPFRYSMEYILDWHLIYRTAQQVAALAPDAAPPDQCRTLGEDLGVNIFLEVRKPPHG
jgi:extracellular factor (EF) 3-hydroxypalmitic acid methyl ester biosynthesis protein